MAKANGVEELLPYTIKGSDEGRRRREAHGLRIKGTGIGQRVKGKAWERTMKSRLGERKQAMLGMPAMVQQWKQFCSFDCTEWAQEAVPLAVSTK
ncbi:MAG: hypothetical protein Q9192_006866 [Flavoplaca navasiana]